MVGEDAHRQGQQDGQRRTGRRDTYGVQRGRGEFADGQRGAGSFGHPHRQRDDRHPLFRAGQYCQPVDRPGRTRPLPRCCGCQPLLPVRRKVGCAPEYFEVAAVSGPAGERLGEGGGVGGALDDLDGIARSHLALIEDAEIGPGTARGGEKLHQI